MLNPEVSIIVPVFNAEIYLSKCIDSILKQSFQNFEILLIDDGSIDNSSKICDEYALRDRRIKVYHKINGGVSSARNLGLRKAIGKWIYFVDSDDTLFVDCLETLLMQTSDDIDCSIGGYIDVYENKAVGFLSEINKRWDYKTALLDFYKPVYFRFNGYLWNRLFRHSIIQENNISFHEDIYFKEDGLFIVEFICKSKKDLKITTKPIYNYFINPNGAMQSLSLYFNKKYLTNMDARILCWENIKNTIRNDWKLKYEAKKSIVELYYIVQDLMVLHNVDDKSIEIDLLNKMSGYISTPFRYVYQIERTIHKLILKIKSVLYRIVSCLRKK